MVNVSALPEIGFVEKGRCDGLCDRVICAFDRR